MDQELRRIVRRVCGEDSKLEEWLTSEGLTTVEDVALLAVDEAAVDRTVIPAAKAKGMPTEQLRDVVNVKKVWKACRTSMTGTTSGGTGFDGDVPLPEGIKKECDSLWGQQHNFTIGACRLLIPCQQNPLHLATHAARKDFPIVQVKKIKMQSGSSTCETDEKVADDNTPHAANIRLRAFWTTMAYINIDQPAYLDYQTTEELCDKILDWVHRRHRAGRPPTSFFLNAWEQTSRVLQSGVRNGKTLKELLTADSSFQHFWTVYVPEGQSVQGREESSGSRTRGQDLSEKEKFERTLSKVQREKDLQIQALKRQLESSKSGTSDSSSKRPNTGNPSKWGWKRR